MNAVHLNLSSAQRDRSVGVLVGTAAGDALGAGYEFGSPIATDHPLGMIGGGLGPFKPGEWTDDTSMAIAIAEVAAAGVDLRDEKSLDHIVERWQWWARNAKDVDNQTRSVLTAAGQRGISAKTARDESSKLHSRTGHTAGNGSLMRTAPVALACLHDESVLAKVARTVSELTHFDPDAGDACVLWCTAIRHAVLTGELQVRIGLGHIDIDRRDLWAARIDEAEASQPSDFATNNGWVVAALQAAWSAIITTPVPVENPAAEVFRVDHLRLALEAAVRGGGDTDTVAAIAGGLLGATYGASAIPFHWRLVLRAGQASESADSPSWPTRSSIKALRSRSMPAMGPGAVSPNRCGIPTTTTCGSAPPQLCTSCPPVLMRSCRCAESLTVTFRQTPLTSMCGSSIRRVRTPISTSPCSIPSVPSSNSGPKATRCLCIVLLLIAGRPPLQHFTEPGVRTSISVRHSTRCAPFCLKRIRTPTSGQRCVGCIRPSMRMQGPCDEP